MMRRFFLLLCGVLISSILNAQELSYRIEKSYFLPASDTVQIDDVLHQEFLPYQHDLHLGFQPQAVWLKFDISPSGIDSNPADPMVLRMGPYQLDSISLYEFDGQKWMVQTAGDRVPVAKRICPDDTHCFALISRPDKPVSVYLKVMQRGVFSVKAEVLPWSQLPEAVSTGTGRISAAIAIAASLLVMALVLLLIDGSVLLFSYVCFQAVVVVFILSTTGRISLIFPSLSPIEVDNLAHHLFNMRVMMFILLGWASLFFYKPNKLYKMMVIFLLCITLVAAYMIQTGEIKQALILYLTASGLNLFVQSYGVFSAERISFKVRALLIFAYIVYMLVLIGALLVIFGQLMPISTSNLVNSFADWRINGGPAGIIIFLIVIIQQSERKVATSQVIGKLRLEAATSQANQEKLTERQTLIDMLTHELKNPLGTIRFALASLKKQSRTDTDTLARVTRMDRSVERMNELIEHVAHSNKIDRFEISAEKEMIDAAELIDELTSDYQSERRFSIDIDEGVFFFTHRHMLTVVLENLINNAYKYDDRRVPIHIRVICQNAVTVFEIHNSIDPSIQPDESKVFQRYYRHDSVQSLPGMGIGLSLVETAAEKIGATVTCEVQSHTVSFKVEVPR